MLLSSSTAFRLRGSIAALAVLAGLATPSEARACSLCVDAASRVNLPGVLDAGRVLLLFFVASAALALFGRISGAEWRLGSKLYWLVAAAALLGGFLGATTGLTLAAGPPVIVASLVRIYQASKLPNPSRRELLSAVLAGLVVVVGPAAFLIGNQRANSLDYLFASLASGNPVTSQEALKVLKGKDDATVVACGRLEELKIASPVSQESRPMEWLGLMRLAESKGTCPEAVLSVQKLCSFPEEAKMNASLKCAGRSKD